MQALSPGHCLRQGRGALESHNFTCFLYGYETLSLTLREEHRFVLSENGVLRRIFGPKREKVAGGWRKLHNEELHNLYAAPNIILVIK
jgi:hypothetical protein